MAKVSIKAKYKIVSIVGLLICFLSLFLDWYVFKIIDLNGEVITEWRYGLISGWQNLSPEGSLISIPFNEQTTGIPILITILLIISLIGSGCVVFFFDIEKREHLTRLQPQAYLNIFTVLIIGFFIFFFPIFYLIPNGLFFPFLFYLEIESLSTSIYLVSFGYIGMILSFSFFFPYAVFYLRTVNLYETGRNVEKVIEMRIQESQDKIDFDKFISEEMADLRLQEKLVKDNRQYRRRNEE